MTEIIEHVVVGVIAVFLGGVVVPLLLNWAIDKWGWFKMTEHKYTDDEITRALECKAEAVCKICDFKEYVTCERCVSLYIKHALDLIKRQKAEIERLAKLLDCYEETSGNKKAKAEAIKDFAERLKGILSPYPDVPFREMVGSLDIDNLVKEMTEGTE